MSMEASFMTHLRSSPPGAASFSGFERFFREEYPAVVRIAFGVVGDAQAAQDVAQDVFISAFKRFPEPGESDHARAWVRAAAAHTALNAIRGERRGGRGPPGPCPPPGGGGGGGGAGGGRPARCPRRARRRPCWTPSPGPRSGG